MKKLFTIVEVLLFWHIAGASPVSAEKSATGQPVIRPDATDQATLSTDGKREFRSYYPVKIVIDNPEQLERLKAFTIGIDDVSGQQVGMVLVDSLAVVQQMGIPFERYKLEPILRDSSESDSLLGRSPNGNICAYATKNGNTYNACSGTCNTTSPYYAGGVDLDCGSISGTTANWQFTTLPYNCAQSYTMLQVGFYGSGTGWPDDGASILIYRWDTQAWVEIRPDVGTGEALYMANAPDLIIGHYIEPTFHDVAVQVYASGMDCSRVNYVQASYCYDEKFGNINATSSPSGASVYVNNVFKGITPISISMPTGTYTVKMSRTCYYDASSQAVVTCNGNTPVNLTLTPVYGSVMFTSNPSGATVNENSVPLGTTPFTKHDVLPGLHNYVFVKSCYQNCDQLLNTICLTNYSLNCNLTPLSASINFSSSPSGAEVYENAAYLGTTPFTKSDVTPDSHTYVFKANCYDDCSQLISACGGSQSVDCALSALETIVQFSSTPSGAEVYEDSTLLGATPFSKNDVSQGQHSYIAKLSGYQDNQQDVDVVCGQSYMASFPLAPIVGRIQAYVKAHGGVTPVPDVPINVSGPGYDQSKNTDPGGLADFGDVPYNTYTVTPSLSGHVFQPTETSVDVNSSSPCIANFTDATNVGCCVGRVGDANGSGDDEPTIGDISVMIDAKFITGDCGGILTCLTEADINQSGGANPTCDDITIGDISILIDYLFITGQSMGLPNCL